MFLILFVLHDPEKLRDVLDAWEDAGVCGITVIPSTGIGRLKECDFLRDDLPLIPSLEDLYKQEEKLNRTIFSIVEDEDMVDKVVKATEDLIGDLDEPYTGIITVLPVARTYGINKRRSPNENSNS